MNLDVILLILVCWSNTTSHDLCWKSEDGGSCDSHIFGCFLLNLLWRVNPLQFDLTNTYALSWKFLAETSPFYFTGFSSPPRTGADSLTPVTIPWSTFSSKTLCTTIYLSFAFLINLLKSNNTNEFAWFHNFINEFAFSWEFCKIR